ncbi:cytochrome P450 [Candidatus Phycosocius spiralis]|uniref:Cytochrome P450 n=1 Tax=Candidatus Phycosocius spiralis TaxID=2815099 RepID=A0ABQ4PY92_9PROT|nr:cytochrome P450 [Candidatus Phycosocius spiralis]GIU67977.1 cytochrome P450 [Candidatus Phycosocius spiralis]
MADGNFNPTEYTSIQDFHAERAWSVPLEEIDMSMHELWTHDCHWSYFERLRQQAPVHWCESKEARIGGYWSITRYHDIMAVDINHQQFSSDAFLGGITIVSFDQDFILPMFIAMDPPKHDAQRKIVQPIVGPENLAKMEATIRERVNLIFDELPIDEEFDWVDKVSVELTTQMLATLFDFPWEDRRKLTRWSDVTTALPVPGGIVETEDQRRAELFECLAYFTNLWNQRVNHADGTDLISMLARGEATKNMEPREYLGNLMLLIVGGNDTTRNSLTGGVYALSKFPEEAKKLRDNPNLIPNMVSEIIRWQTPLAHMRRTAVEDVEMGDKLIKKGDKVVMWYVSGNRDETAIERPNDFWIDRPRARNHLSFGFGIHRCVGNRLAEMQIRIVWEEVLKRYSAIEVVSEPRRLRSSFVKGYTSMRVILRR